ncbi:hypothetical protein BUALT_Bualt07G0059400 [Buddleja alternifolia]|uniref:pectinesterase n=1 Tax=Buddleja alternifolia TaxID=168488 RepID=A0AAV6X8P4_9LAMI|nr:hypothetical protein BUALT_Bualt07G0059400 [Buddleja alternifolia]
MESLNFIKGYDKVTSLENPKFPAKPPTTNNNRRKIIAISSAIFLTLVIASLAAALIHASAYEHEESDPSPTASTSAETLKTVCSVTRYPDSCFSSISPLNIPPSNNPLRFLNLSLHASAIEVSALKNLVTESKAESAIKDCAELFDDAASQLGRSAELLCVDPGEKVLTEEMKMSDLQTWISAAMTDQETCIDGMEEMGSTAVGEFKMKVHKSQEYMSNTLAILNNIPSLFHKLGLTMP